MSTAPAPSTEPAGGQQADPPAPTPTPTESAGGDRLPDDHPLVTAFTTTKSELAEARAKLKTFEDAKKSDIDRATEQAAAEKERADKAEANAARLAAAVKYSLTPDDLELLDGVPADKVDERAKKISERLGDRKKHTNVVPKEGSTPTATPSDERAFVRELFGGG